MTIQYQSIQPLTSEQFRAIQRDLGWTHAATAAALGLSKISVRRIATGAQFVTHRTANVLIAFLVLHQAGLMAKYNQTVMLYRGDTNDGIEFDIGLRRLQAVTRAGAVVRKIGTSQLMVVKEAADLVANSPSRSAVAIDGRVLCQWTNARGRRISRSFRIGELEIAE